MADPQTNPNPTTNADEEAASSSSAGEGSKQEVLEIVVKTLEPRQFSVVVPKQAKVSDLKQILLDVTSIPIELQRLIFQGKALRDDKLLSEYGINENGVVVHLVQRPRDVPPRSQDSEPTPPPPPQPARPNVLVGAIHVDADPSSLGQVEQIVHNVIHSIGQRGGAVPMAAVSGSTGSQASIQQRLANVSQMVQRATQIHRRTASAVENVDQRSQRQSSTSHQQPRESSQSESSSSFGQEMGDDSNSMDIDSQGQTTSTTRETLTSTSPPVTSASSTGNASPSNDSAESSRTNIRQLAEVLGQINNFNLSIQPTLQRLEASLLNDADIDSEASRQAVQRLLNTLSRSFQSMSQAYVTLAPILRSVRYHETLPGQAHIRSEVSSGQPNFSVHVLPIQATISSASPVPPQSSQNSQPVGSEQSQASSQSVGPEQPQASSQPASNVPLQVPLNGPSIDIASIATAAAQAAFQAVSTLTDTSSQNQQASAQQESTRANPQHAQATASAFNSGLFQQLLQNFMTQPNQENQSRNLNDLMTNMASMFVEASQSRGPTMPPTADNLPPEATSVDSSATPSVASVSSSFSFPSSSTTSSSSALSSSIPTAGSSTAAVTTSPQTTTSSDNEPNSSTNDALPPLPSHSMENVASESWISLIPDAERAIWAQTIAEDRHRLQQSRLRGHYTDIYEHFSSAQRRKQREEQTHRTSNPDQLLNHLLRRSAEHSQVHLPELMLSSQDTSLLNRLMQTQLRRDANARLHESDH